MNRVREQLRGMLTLQPNTDGLSATLNVSANLCILPDHFSSGPILPGVCMIQAVLLAIAEQRHMRELQLSTLKTAKMMAPVRPGDVVTIEATLSPLEDGRLAIKAKLFCHEQRCAEFSFTARPLFTVGSAESAQQEGATS